jgi:hypothetical protein
MGRGLDGAHAAAQSRECAGEELPGILPAATGFRDDGAAELVVGEAVHVVAVRPEGGAQLCHGCGTQVGELVKLTLNAV